jgi:hypothetical protein
LKSDHAGPASLFRSTNVSTTLTLCTLLHLFATLGWTHSGQKILSKWISSGHSQTFDPYFMCIFVIEPTNEIADLLVDACGKTDPERFDNGGESNHHQAFN